MGANIKDLPNERLFISSEVLKAVNITYRQLSYWELKGIIKPTYQKLGTRDFKRYTQQDIDTLGRVKGLLDEGYALPATDTLKEIARRKEAEESIKHKLEFEKTISSISSRFISVSNIDEVINASLADIGRLSGANRSYLFLFKEDGLTTMDNTHEWCAEGVSPQIDNLQNLPSDMVLWWMKKLRNGEVIHIKDVSKLPSEAKAEKEILEGQDIKSLLVLPLSIAGKLAGFIGFDNVVRTGEWNNEDLALLRISSEIIGNALERKKAEEKIRLFSDAVVGAIDAIAITDMKGIISYVNPAKEETYGYKRGELIGKHVSIFNPKPEMFKETLLNLMKTGNWHGEVLQQKKNKEIFPALLSLSIIRDEKGKEIGMMGVVRDITECKKVEKKQVLRFEILKIFHQHGSLKNMHERAISLIKEYLDCEVVALRLKKDEDYPYFINNGFPEEFIKSENYLCIYDEKGNCLRDSRGKLVLACMCGIVINAKFNQDKPFFTKNGSFWTNSTSDLLASTNEKERGATTRNVCNQYGYESVALIPIKSSGDNLGLLHITDKRRNLFSADNINFLEELGHIIGMMVECKWTEETLLKSEDRYRKLLKNSDKELVKFIQSKEVS